MIASSPGELEPVFQAMLANAARVCEGKFGSLYLYDGERFHAGALHNAPPAFAEFRRSEPEFRPPPGSGLAELVATRRTVHTPDIMLDKGYVDRNPIIVSSVELAVFEPCWPFPCSRTTSWSVASLSTARKCVRLATSRSSWSEFRLAGGHRHREHAAAERAARIAGSSRPPPPKCSKSSAARTFDLPTVTQYSGAVRCEIV